MSRVRKFMGGAGVGLVGQALNLLVGLWMTPFLLARLGQETYGYWMVALQVLSYLALLDLGIVALLPREVARAHGAAAGQLGDSEVPDVVGQSIRVVLWQTPVVLVAVTVAWLSLPADWGGLVVPLLVAGVAFVVVFPLRLVPAALHGLQDLAFAGIASQIGWLLNIGVVVVLILQGHGLMAVAVGWAVWQVVIVGLGILRLRTKFPELWLRRLPPRDRVRQRTLMKGGAWVSLNVVAQILMRGTDVLIIERFVGASAVVPYSVTAKLVLIFGNLPNTLLILALPGLAQIRGSADRSHLDRVSHSLGQGTLVMSGFLAVPILLANQGFVEWWVGPRLFGGWTMTIILVLTMVVRHFNFTFSTTVFSLGRERGAALLRLAEGALVTGLSLALVRPLGPMAVVLAMAVGAITIGLPGNLWIVSRELKVPVLRLLGRHSSWGLKFAALSVCLVFLGQYWQPSTLLGILLAGALASGGYFALMLTELWRDPLGGYVRPRFEPLVKRFFRGS